MLLKWLLDRYHMWKFDREFEKKKKEIMKLDPFIYDIPKDDKKN
jgi:hypothetical protein